MSNGLLRLSFRKLIYHYDLNEPQYTPSRLSALLMACQQSSTMLLHACHPSSGSDLKKVPLAWPKCPFFPPLDRCPFKILEKMLICKETTWWHEIEEALCQQKCSLFDLNKFKYCWTRYQHPHSLTRLTRICYNIYCLPWHISDSIALLELEVRFLYMMISFSECMD